MKTNMKLKGFTLIELLVVIVIIGILATISVATFSGYFAKARDTERQTFVAAARTAMLAEQVGQSSADYRLTTTATAVAVEAAIKAVFTNQGISIPSGTNTYVVLNSDVTAAAATSFAVVAMKEEDTATCFSAGPYAFLGDCGTTTAGVYTANVAETAINLD